MATIRWPRGGWTGTPQPPPPPNPYLKLVAEAILERTEGDDFRFLCFTSAEPRPTAVGNLPGDSDEAKVGYFVDWLEEGFERGLSAWDLFGASHDSDLAKAAPRKRPGDPRISDPREAVVYVFGDGWREGDGYYRQAKALADNPNAAETRRALYEKRALG